MTGNEKFLTNAVSVYKGDPNEITTSLKKFAAMTLLTPDEFRSPIDEIIKDLAYNGVIVEQNSQKNLSPAQEQNGKRKPQYEILRETKRTPRKVSKCEFQQFCVFCENNNEPEAVVRSHAVRDNLGRVLCPKLRTYTCPICGVSGDKAHTIKYCPKKPIITMEDTILAESIRLSGLYALPYTNGLCNNNKANI